MTGLTWAPVEMMFRFMNVTITGAGAFYTNQRVYCEAVNTYFHGQMGEWQQQHSGSRTVLVDTRYDTPGRLKYSTVQYSIYGTLQYSTVQYSMF